MLCSVRANCAPDLLARAPVLHLDSSCDQLLSKVSGILADLSERPIDHMWNRELVGSAYGPDLVGVELSLPELSEQLQPRWSKYMTSIQSSIFSSSLLEDGFLTQHVLHDKSRYGKLNRPWFNISQISVRLHLNIYLSVVSDDLSSGKFWQFTIRLPLEKEVLQDCSGRAATVWEENFATLPLAES